MKILIAAIATLSFSAFASGDRNGTNRELTFEQFKESCRNPGQYHAQREPRNIKVLCTDKKTTWVPAQSRTIRVNSQREITAEVMSDKYHVRASTFEIGMPSAEAKCPVLKEIVKTLSTEHSLRCADVLNFKGGLKDYCLNVVDRTINENGDLVNVSETGRTVSTCGRRPTQQRRPNQQG